MLITFLSRISSKSCEGFGSYSKTSFEHSPKPETLTQLQWLDYLGNPRPQPLGGRAPALAVLVWVGGFVCCFCWRWDAVRAASGRGHIKSRPRSQLEVPRPVPRPVPCPPRPVPCCHSVCRVLCRVLCRVAPPPSASVRAYLDVYSCVFYAILP